MRVALVVERFVPQGGGVEGAAWQVAHALARAGDRVDVIARTGPPDREVALPEHIRLHPIPVPTSWQPLRVRRFSRRAHDMAQRLAPLPDLVHGFARIGFGEVFRAGGGSHADYMARTYGAVGRRLRRLSPRHRVLLDLEARTFEDDHRLIHCVSHMVRDEISARYGLPETRFRVIHNGVDLEAFAPEPLRAEALRLRSEWNVDEACPIWLFAGSGGRRKGLDTALRALAQARDRSAILVVAGRSMGREFHRLVERLELSGRVRFVGERADMATVYAASDGLILPTRYDPFANVCLEAAAAGLPVVTSATNGSSEALQGGASVIDYPEDPAASARALDALGTPSAWRPLGYAARRRAATMDWDRHAQALRSMYEEVLESRSRSVDPALRAGAR